MRKMYKVIDKNGYSFDSDDRAYFSGTQEECEEWIANKEFPEHYKTTYTKAEEDRRSLLYKLTGTSDPKFITEREEVMIDKFLGIKADYDKKLDKSAESAADNMENFVNNFGCPETKFLELMTIKHRTLQQSFTKLCLKWIEKVAADEYTYDGRNEASHKTCKRLMENWKMKNPDDKIHMDEDMLKSNPPSKWLPMV